MAGFDNDESCIKTYDANLGVGHKQDICELGGKELLNLVGLKKGELSLLAAGPSCQGFSNINKLSSASDERNNLVLEVIRLVDEVNPKMFLMENVASISTRGKDYIDSLYRRLKNYRITGKLYNSADYGVSQTRERYIVIGVRNDLNRIFQPPTPPYYQDWKTLRDAIGDLPKPPQDGSCHEDYYNHCKAKITKETEERFSYVPQGGGWRDMPAHLWQVF